MDLVEPLGADTLVHAKLGKALVTARLPGQVDLAEGARLTLQVDPASIHVFDASGDRF